MQSVTPNRSADPGAPQQGLPIEFPCQLFLHCIASMPGFDQLTSHVPGVDKYSERALLLAGHEDVVFLNHQAPQDYLRFLNKLSIGPDPSNVLPLPNSTPTTASVPMTARLESWLSSARRFPSQLTESDEVWLNHFAASHFDPPLRSSLSTNFGRRVRFINRLPSHINLYDKHQFRQHAEDCGLELPPGESVRVNRRDAMEDTRMLPLARAADKYFGVTGRVIIRGALGASGSSVFVVGDRGELRKCLRTIDRQRHTDFYLVEPFYDVVVSPNIGMFIDPRDRQIFCVSISDQIFDERIQHRGNCYPSQAKLIHPMIATAKSSCEWLRDQGATGYLGFDFCEYIRPGTNERNFFFAELNPRFNGATYPAHLFHRLKAQFNHHKIARWHTFRSLTMPTSLSSFTALQRSCEDLLFDGQRSVGFIPYNVGLLQHGKMMLVMIGESTREVVSLENEISRRLIDHRQVRISNTPAA